MLAVCRLNLATFRATTLTASRLAKRSIAVTSFNNSRHSACVSRTTTKSTDLERLQPLATGTRHRSLSYDVHAQRLFENEVKNFKWEVPEYFNFAVDVVDAWAEKEKTNERDTSLPALWWVNSKGDELKWSFQDLKSYTTRTAKFLHNVCGIRKGDRVIVILHRVPEWWMVCLGCKRIGAVVSPGSPQLTAKDIAYRLDTSKATTIVTDKEHAVMADQYKNKDGILKNKIFVSDDKMERDGWLSFDKLYKNSDDDFESIQTKHHDHSMIYFTSGTTGKPKMALHTHTSWGIGHYVTGKHWLSLTSKDVFWTLSDTGWALGAYGYLFSPWIMGACVFVYHEPRFDPVQTLKVLSSHPITVFLAGPTIYRMMLLNSPEQYKFPYLRRCVSGGESVNPDLVLSWKKATGCSVYEGWGQTETVLLLGTFPGVKQRLGWIGKAVPGFDIRIVDENGVEQPNGTEGIIGVKVFPDRPVGLFAGYLDNEARNKAAFCGDYYLTGDRGIKDDEGYFRFISRDDDIISSAGYRIGPTEVENALFEHPAVAESAAVSSPDEVRGGVVKAFVVLKEEYKDHDKDDLIKELQEHTKKITAPYKYPRKIEFIEELPKTVSNKIQRFTLRNQEWNKE
ncbi:acyl-coenzyme A synthetase ACSM3, mitochondrial-like [Saccoglossus kowalevskii]|uniref:medium-chain acyl-CoA ligase n=1 Tax=Saccoglossus kowalevskii TaxID=10224 RepID=A0ABM0MVV2_SACKO|nr:PREDICTED: acyl-coenzyme A synthetase ACSM3, mitochondrial-like [Saccoglossus kowalevskii]